MQATVSRRQIVVGGAAASLAALLSSGRFASTSAHIHQEARAAATLADLGLPELVVTATDDSYTISESEVAAGRYLITFENQTEGELYAAFLQFADGITIDDLNAALADAESEEPPEWLYTLASPGGAIGYPGGTTRFALDLHSGEYGVHADLPGLPFGAAGLTVTGEFPAEVTEIESDVVVDMIEMAFEITGELAAGVQIVQYNNAGLAPHFAVLVGVPEGTTIEDFFALGAAFASGEFPDDLVLTPDQITPGFETTTQSPGTTLWSDVSLTPGSYILSCFVFDPELGAPHAMLGMTNLLTVE